MKICNLFLIGFLLPSLAFATFLGDPTTIKGGGTGLSTVPSAGQILIGNAGGTAYALALMSGDATMAASGALTIANSAITNAKIANSTIDLTTKVTGVLPSANVNGGRTVNAQVGTTYTFALADGSGAGGFPLVTLNNASAITATVPTNASVAFPVGTQIDVAQLGAGTVTITAAGGVTINTASSLAMSQYAGGTLVKTATDTWQFYAGGGGSGITALTGDVTASGSGSVAATIANLAVTNAKIANSTIDLTAKVTGVLPNANTTAASANTASAIVARDVSGNFTAGTITAALTGTASGNLQATATNHGVLVSGSGNTASVTAVGATNTVLHGNTGADPTYSAIVNADITNSTIDLATKVTGILPDANLPAPTTSAISASAIDWSTLIKKGGLYTKTLGANTTFTWSNVAAGQTIVIALTNTASNYTVTWPAAAKWPGGTAPTQTVGAHTDVITCISYDGTNAYCQSVQNF